MAQNRILIEFHTIARVVVGPKATDNTTSVFFYLDDRPTLSRKSWKETTSSGGKYEKVSPEDSFTLMLGQVVRVPEQILLLEFENQYYAAKVKPVLKEVAGCWLVPVFEVRVESAEAAKSALPSFPQKRDEERKLRAKERLTLQDRCVPRAQKTKASSIYCAKSSFMLGRFASSAASLTVPMKR